MSLAFNVHGEPFEVPSTATMWRVRRVKPKGAPEVVYGRDGAPLLLGIGADVEDLKRENVEPGRYRLDAVDDNQRPILDVAPAYVLLHGETKATSRAAADRDQVCLEALRLASESMRAQTELARVVVEKFPAMMESAAVLLRAADGAGLPARPPMAIVNDDDDQDDEDDQDDGQHRAAPMAPAAPGPDLATVIAQTLPAVLSAFASKNAPAAAPSSAAQERNTAPRSAETKPDASAVPPAAMSHFLAIQQELTPPERSLAKALVSELAPEQRRSWLGELAAMPVPAAADRVRALLHSEPRKEPSTKAQAKAQPPEGSDTPGDAAPATQPEAMIVPPAAMAHFLAIQQALTPQERALAQGLASELTPRDLRAWMAELSALSVPIAVERIRALLHVEPTKPVPTDPGASGGAS